MGTLSLSMIITYLSSLIQSTHRDIHREQLSIEHSMRDLDSAVGRLDNILMTVYAFVAVLIMAVTLVSSLLQILVSLRRLIWHVAVLY